MKVHTHCVLHVVPCAWALCIAAQRVEPKACMLLLIQFSTESALCVCVRACVNKREEVCVCVCVCVCAVGPC